MYDIKPLFFIGLSQISLKYWIEVTQDLIKIFPKLSTISVCSPTVRIIAFQAIDPGSTPGKRIAFTIIDFYFTF